MSILVKSNVVFVDGAVAFTGASFAACHEWVQQYIHNMVTGQPAAAPVALDPNKGELRRMRNGNFGAWHPDYNHPRWGHYMLMGTESACRAKLGWPPSEANRAAKEAAMAQIKPKLAKPAKRTSAAERLADKDIAASTSAERTAYLQQTLPV